MGSVRGDLLVDIAVLAVMMAAVIGIALLAQCCFWLSSLPRPGAVPPSVPDGDETDTVARSATFVSVL